MEKYHRQEALGVDEARALLPQRELFAALWRWLKGNGALDTGLDIAPGQLAEQLGCREHSLQVQVCLDVMCERGLLTQDGCGDRLRIRLRNVEGKVDLEASPIMVRLRQQARLPL